MLEGKYKEFLAECDIEIGGSRPWDIQIHNPKVYNRVFLYGSLGFGEAYMDGWWSVEDLEGFLYRLLRSIYSRKTHQALDVSKMLLSLQSVVLNLQSKSRAFMVGEQHYNIGNDLFEKMLDKRMIYTCGYWKGVDTLDDAQEQKLRLIFDKLMLSPGMKVLDIGCGWGGSAKFLAEQYGVSVVGVTVSTAQAEVAREKCKGLPVEILVSDYRDVDMQFDRIYSIGMFEHVGRKNYKVFFDTCHRLLVDEGLFVLHTIGNSSRAHVADPWISKYIFPNGYIPKMGEVVSASRDLFLLEDFQNFGSDYHRTLMAWYDNFKGHWDTIKENKVYDERFYRMWEFYLTSCAASFRCRSNNLWQFVFSKGRRESRYDSPR